MKGENSPPRALLSGREEVYLCLMSCRMLKYARGMGTFNRMEEGYVDHSKITVDLFTRSCQYIYPGLTLKNKHSLSCRGSGACVKHSAA